MNKETSHPLEKWLKKRGLNKNQFAQLNGIPFRAIYEHTAGRVKDPRLRVLLQIERATAKGVTACAMIAWWRNRL